MFYLSIKTVLIISLISIFEISDIVVIAVEEPLVHIEHGTIRGSSHLTTVKGRKIYSFEGIPYARPPVGKYRFRVSFFGIFI